MKTTNKPILLCVNDTYQDLQIGLFQGEHLLDHHEQAQARCSVELLPALDILLKKHSLTLSDVTYLAVAQGPGSFHSLRALLATVNGIAAASGVPLIGIDMLDVYQDCLAARTGEGGSPIGCVVLNAYNNEVFYRFIINSVVDNHLVPGPSGAAYATIDAVHAALLMCQQRHRDRIALIGSDQVLCAAVGRELPAVYQQVSTQELLSCMVKRAMSAIAENNHTGELQPLYLKKTTYRRLDEKRSEGQGPRT